MGLVARGLGVWRAKERFRFLVVGAYNTVFGYACFASLYLAFGKYVNYLLVQLIAHFFSVGNAFYWHRRLTFRSSVPWWPKFIRFNVSYLGILAFGLVALPALVQGLSVQPLIAAAIVTVVSVASSYVLHARFSFGSRRGSKPP
jgi:putative flippase GtrA